MGKLSRPEEQAAHFCRRSNLCVLLMQRKMASLDVHVVANILCLVLANLAVSESTMLGAHQNDGLPDVLRACVLAPQCCPSWCSVVLDDHHHLKDP